MVSALGSDMNSLAPRLAIGRLHLALRCAAVASLLLMAAPIRAAGQGDDGMQPMATRSDLTALASRLERGGEEDRARAAALRARIREGDFRPGDRIALLIEGNVILADTASVTAGSKIRLPDIGDISLAGVLRSELQEHMKTQLAKYIRDARVRAVPLVSLAVLGPVGRPGFYFLPPDISLSEAVMRAGGPAGNADLSRSVIRRASDNLYDAKNTQSALTQGLTLDQLSLRSGDEILVGTQSTRSWQQVASTLSVITSLLLAISYGLARR